MATIVQLTKKNLRQLRRKTYSRAPILKKNPQRRGVCTKVYKMPPKKPCSARRSVAWVLFIKGFEKKGALCHIPGETHNLRMYSRVLVRGGRVKDLPGVRCRIIRTTHHSVSDLFGLYKRQNSRSRYGARNTLMTHNIRLYRYVLYDMDFWNILNEKSGVNFLKLKNFDPYDFAYGKMTNKKKWL
jgi:small subunit ribosomal protein S12